jgi:hypothetical protein
MIYQSSVEIKGTTYCFAIRVKEKIEVLDELLVPNLTPLEGTK